jgi:hypothetical protein
MKCGLWVVAVLASDIYTTSGALTLLIEVGGQRHVIILGDHPIFIEHNKTDPWSQIRDHFLSYCDFWFGRCFAFFFLSGEGARSRRYWCTAALRLIVQPYDEDDDDDYYFLSFS